VLRAIGIIIVSPVLIKSAMLFVQGGSVEVQEAIPLDTEIVLSAIEQEPVFIAIVPFIFSLITIAGFLKNWFSFLWIGCVGILITGTLFLFSLGIYISLIGVVVLAIILILYKVNVVAEQ